MSINFEPEIIVIPAGEMRGRSTDGVACRASSQVSKGHRGDHPLQDAEAALNPRIKSCQA